MTTAQLAYNGQNVDGSPEDIIKFLQNVSKIAKKTKAKTKRTETFEDFIIRQITPHLGSDLSQEIVSCLVEIKNTHPDFRKFRVMYHKVETIEHRQLLKVVSAAYRLKYAQFMGDSYLSGIFSTIKYATVCPHCGRFASEFIVRLKQEGLIQ